MATRVRGNDLIERVPASIQLRLIPILDESSGDARVVSRMSSVGAASAPTTLEEVCDGKHISKCYHDRYVRGDRRAVLDLLEIGPAFVRERWVREALDELERARGFMPPRAQGRPSRWTKESHLVRTALVALVDHRAARTGKSREKILEELADRRFENLSRETIRLYYYSTRRDPRFRPLLVTSEDQVGLTTRRELEEELRGLVPDSLDGTLLGRRRGVIMKNGQTHE